MKKLNRHLKVIVIAILMVASLSFPTLLGTTNGATQRSQNRVNPSVTIRQDPTNPRRKIIELPKITRTAEQIRPATNLLDTAGFQRRPIPFQKFEMVNPATKKPINPNARITLPNRATITVQEYFDGLNKLEAELTKRGHTLRDTNTFANARPNFNRAAFSTPANTPAGYVTLSPEAYQTRRTQMDRAPKMPEVTSGSTATPTGGGAQPAGSWISLKLYVAEVGETEGTTEFPVKWVQSSAAEKRHVFPLLVESIAAMKAGLEKNVNELVWQVATQPFSYASGVNLQNPDGLVKSGKVSGLKWGSGYRGIYELKYDGKIYTRLNVDFSTIAAEPTKGPKTYYVRVLTVSNGTLVAPSSEIIANYGAATPAPEVLYDTAKFFNPKPVTLSLPGSDSSPFGVHLKAGMNAISRNQNLKLGGAPLGFNAEADASLSIHYFNFKSLVDSGVPKTTTQEIMELKLSATAGVVTGATGFVGGVTGNYPQGVSLTITAFDIPYDVPITESLSIPGALELNHAFFQPINYDLFDILVWFGPIPVRFTGKLTGAYGLEVTGIVNLKDKTMTALVRPYITTSFSATGKVDVLIAHAGLEASLNPLVQADIAMRFDSDKADPVSFMGSYSALAGHVKFNAGFYYPCAPLQQVKKLWGFITGDNDCPLCETNWDYNIFDSPGFSSNWAN